MLTHGAVKGDPKGAFILTLDSPVSHFTIELGTKRNAVQLNFVPSLDFYDLLIEALKTAGHVAPSHFARNLLSAADSSDSSRRTVGASFSPTACGAGLWKSWLPLSCRQPTSSLEGASPAMTWAVEEPGLVSCG